MNEFFQGMAVNTFKALAIDTFAFCIKILPELCAYGALVTGALVMLSGFFGRGMFRPLSVYSAFLFVSICILEAV